MQRRGAWVNESKAGEGNQEEKSTASCRHVKSEISKNKLMAKIRLWAILDVTCVSEFGKVRMSRGQRRAGQSHGGCTQDLPCGCSTGPARSTFIHMSQVLSEQSKKVEPH